jgi:alpha-glucosidase
MVRRFIFILQGLAVAVIAMAQASFMSDDSIAVFIPANYDASNHQPSPVFVKELGFQG